MSRPTPTSPWPARASSKGCALIGRQAPRPNSRSGPSDCPLARDCAWARLHQDALPEEPAFCRASFLLCIPVLCGDTPRGALPLAPHVVFDVVHCWWPAWWCGRMAAGGGSDVEFRGQQDRAEGLDHPIDTRHCGGSPSRADDDDLGIRDLRKAKGERQRGQGASTPHSQNGAALEIGMSMGVITRHPHPLRRKC